MLKVECSTLKKVTKIEAKIDPKLENLIKQFIAKELCIYTFRRNKLCSTAVLRK
jgi:hypothetical protein